MGGISHPYYTYPSTAGISDIVLVGSNTHIPNVAIRWIIAESSSKLILLFPSCPVNGFLTFLIFNIGRNSYIEH